MIERFFDKFSFDRTPLFTILGCYMVPVLLYSQWSSVRIGAGWTVWAVGLVLTLFGTALLYAVMQALLLSDSEPLPQPDSIIPFSADLPEDQTDLEVAYRDLQEQNALLSEELKERAHQLRETEQQGREQQQRLHTLNLELEELREEGQRRDETKVTELTGLQEIITQQEVKLATQEQYIAKLKKQSADLSYEVKTLLQLGEMEGGEESSVQHQPLHPALDSLESSQPIDVDTLYQTTPTSINKQVGSAYDATVQLHQCIELTEGIESAAHLTNSSRFSDLTDSNQALDLRQLSDSFRAEISSPALFVSPVDGMLLFATNQIQGLLGWTPEKLVKDFYSLLQDGLPEWQQTLKEVESAGEATVRLILRAKSGEDLILYATLGAARTGVFSNYVIAVLYPLLEQ